MCWVAEPNGAEPRLKKRISMQNQITDQVDEIVKFSSQ